MSTTTRNVQTMRALLDQIENDVPSDQPVSTVHGNDGEIDVSPRAIFDLALGLCGMPDDHPLSGRPARLALALCEQICRIAYGETQGYNIYSRSFERGEFDDS